MTLADTIRHQVLTLDAQGIPASHIAHALRIPVERVDRILDDHDAEQGVPHPERIVAPVLEPLGGPAVIVSQAAVGGGRDNDPTRPKRQKRGTVSKPPKPKLRATNSFKASPTPRHLIQCGTLQGYNLHRREGTTTCQPCRDAYNQYNIKLYGRKREPIQCGTYRGWKKHHRRREKPCEDCITAYREKCREWRKTEPKAPWIHGTPEGYQRHRRNKEKACDECQPHGMLNREAEHQRRVEMHAQGMTDNQIAVAVGVARYVIAKWRKRAGLPVNKEVRRETSV